MLRQLPFFSAAEECRWYLDPSRPGFFCTLTKIDGRIRQKSHRLSDMPEVIGSLDPDFDTWCTQGEFFKRIRQLTALARLDLQFIDLDTYRIPHLCGRSPDDLVGATLQFCGDEGLLAPSALIFSGRGLQAKWFLERPVPKWTLPRWNAVQRQLVDRLAPLGADPQARDASRVLRLVNTVNSKSGEICRVVHVTPGLDGKPIRYNFEQMAEELLPYGRQELEQRKRDLAERRQRLRLVGNQSSHLRRLSGKQLAWDRLADLQLLMELRGGAPEGQRMLFLLWQTNFLLLSDITAISRMKGEAAEMARNIDPSWHFRSAELGTVFRKAREFQAGERIEFNGRQYPPMYTPTNDTLINLFKITDDEQRRLRTLISTGMAAERHRARREAGRRAEGAVTREEYLGAAAGKRNSARILRSQGESTQNIAKTLKCSVRSVYGYLDGFSS